MIRIDDIEPILYECIKEINTIIIDKKIDSLTPNSHDKILFSVLDKLTFIIRELDTCMSLACQARDNKEF